MNKELLDFIEPLPENEVKKRLKRVKHKVEFILESDERSRSDDKWLLFQYVKAQTGADIDFNLFKDMPSFESITRCRRKIQEEGRFLPNEETQTERCSEEWGYREFSRE